MDSKFEFENAHERYEHHGKLVKALLTAYSIYAEQSLNPTLFQAAQSLSALAIPEKIIFFKANIGDCVLDLVRKEGVVHINLYLPHKRYHIDNFLTREGIYATYDSGKNVNVTHTRAIQLKQGLEAVEVFDPRGVMRAAYLFHAEMTRIESNRLVVTPTGALLELESIAPLESGLTRITNEKYMVKQEGLTELPLETVHRDLILGLDRIESQADIESLESSYPTRLFYSMRDLDIEANIDWVEYYGNSQPLFRKMKINLKAGGINFREILLEGEEIFLIPIDVAADGVHHVLLVVDEKPFAELTFDLPFMLTFARLLNTE